MWIAVGLNIQPSKIFERLEQLLGARWHEIQLTSYSQKSSPRKPNPVNLVLLGADGLAHCPSFCCRQAARRVSPRQTEGLLATR